MIALGLFLLPVVLPVLLSLVGFWFAVRFMGSALNAGWLELPCDCLDCTLWREAWEERPLA